MLKIFANDRILRRIVESAGAAPSFHNTQPWHFTRSADDVLEVRADLDRALRVADPQTRALHLSCGTALFNLRTAIRMTAFNPLVWPLPQPEFPPTVLAAVQAEPGRPPTFAERELYQAIWQRHTNRDPFTSEPIAPSVRGQLEQAARYEFAHLRMLSHDDARTVLDLAAQANDELADDAAHQTELHHWVGPGRGDDGIPDTALPRRPAHAPAPVRTDLSLAPPSAGPPPPRYEESPQLAVLATNHDHPADWLRAGQALQRVLLTATARGVSASFLYQPIELRDMRGAAAPHWPWDENPQIIIRLGYGPDSPATPRRHLEDILTKAADTSTS
jgi:hypothetical protein